ncbi:hypothetical protein REH65_32425 [Saccharopolyspora sp. ID03-671]|uniref:hypothetical protein n=1 Tax=Saccharopolyspora sp. ID03-671 TaxID=3073066 RepID=UPI00324D2190
MTLPNITRFQYGREKSRIFLNDIHLIGILEHPCDDPEVRVTFCGPSGKRFALPAAEDIPGGTSSIIVASLGYEYRPHEIAVGYFAPRGYGIWCPTCHTAGTSLHRYYPDQTEAEQRVVTVHEDLCGQPAVLVTAPFPLSPDLPPSNAWPTTDHDAP